MKHQLANLLDIPRLQAALDSLYVSSGIPSAIIDNEGVVHTGSGWQDVCTKFHRVHPEARKRCIESDRCLSRRINEANLPVIHECPHGLIDSATPIFVDGEHIGNVFTGQLFFEAPDLDSFRAQGRAYGFDEEEYIAAVKNVPVIPERAMRENLAFVAHLTEMLAEIGVKREREKETGKRLRESEEIFERFMEHSPIFVFFKDENMRALRLSRNYEAMLGMPVAEMLGRTMEELFPSGLAKRMVADDMRIMKEGKAITMEEEFNGRLYSTIKFPILIEGEPRFLAGYTMDITERNRAEEEIKESGERLLEAQQVARLGYYVLDVATGTWTGSKVLDDVFGIGDDYRRDVEGWSLLIHPEERQSMLEYFLDDVLGKKEPFDREYRIVRPSDPSVRWVHGLGKVAYDSRGEAVKMIGTIQDITERKEAEEALRESEGKFRLLTRQFHALLDAIPDNVTRQSHDLRVTWANRGAAAGLKKGPEDLVGNHCYSLWHNRTSACEVCPVLETFRTGEPALEIVTTPDGRTWELRSVPVMEAGSVVEVVEIGRNVTEQRKLQAQLQQAMKMEAVGRLAGGVAHDFNNLLTVITGYSELLLQKIGKESPMRREVEEIQRAGERAASLTQQLLAFSRKQIIEPKVLQLDSLVAEMHKMLTRLIGEDISLRAITGRSPGSVKVDPGQIQQILMNLVVNARDAMPDGGKITIETGNVDLDEGYCALHPYVTPGRFVMLAVSDTGKGMSEEVKSQIFEPFFTTKERGSGTGLGLATTYGAVKQAGGSIEVYSEVGIGTTLRIYLPRIEEEAVKPEKVDRRSNLPGGTETVLLVEDEETLRTLCERILGELGYTVLPAGNGAEAIALARKYGDRIDLLLTDVVMPGMNGSELATQLVLHHPEMKVLFMSGYTDDAITRHGVLDEGVSFIGKPYTPAALARKVREVLDEK